MASPSLPPVVQGLVPVVVGLVTTLMGFGLVPSSFDAKKAAKWKSRYGSKAMIGGPLLILAGLALVARALLW